MHYLLAYANVQAINSRCQLCHTRSVETKKHLFSDYTYAIKLFVITMSDVIPQHFTLPNMTMYQYFTSNNQHQHEVVTNVITLHVMSLPNPIKFSKKEFISRACYDNTSPRLEQ